MKFNQRNVVISSKAVIGNNVRIGDNSVIYDNVVIGDNSVIANDCIIGEPLSTYYYDENYVNPPTIIGKNALIRSHTIIYCNSNFGDNFTTGHRATIRERTTMGINCAVGTMSELQGDSFFGDYCRLHSKVFIGQKSTIGNFVFIYPYVIFTDDPHPPSHVCIGATVGDYSQIAANSILLPGIKIGKMCLVGANTTVNRDIPDESIVVGTPGKVIGSITKIKSKENSDKSHYPWMYNFERGMPWEGIGYDEWLNNSNKL